MDRRLSDPEYRILRWIGDTTCYEKRWKISVRDIQKILGGGLGKINKYLNHLSSLGYLTLYFRHNNKRSNYLRLSVSLRTTGVSLGDTAGVSPGDTKQPRTKTILKPLKLLADDKNHFEEIGTSNKDMGKIQAEGMAKLRAEHPEILKNHQP